MSYQKPFIPAWLDDAKLSQAEFRLYCHLCRRADNATGIAWPAYQSIQESCGFSHKTVWATLCKLVERGLIAKAGKPFGGSCRYRILALIDSNHTSLEAAPIVSSGEGLNHSNSFLRGTNEDCQSFPSGNSNHSPRETPIVSSGERKGNPIKVLQGRKSTKAASPPFEATVEETQFADWFKSSLPQNEQERLVKNWRTNFSKTYRQLLNIDKRTPEEIRRVCQWARTDSFWQTNFKSPSKLRDRNGQGVLYFDVFLDRMTSTSTQPTKPQTPIKTGSRTSDIEIL
jgi:hypothetical protein